MDLGFNLAPSNRDLKDPTSRQNFGDTSGLLCKNDLIPCHMQSKDCNCMVEQQSVTNDCVPDEGRDFGNLALPIRSLDNPIMSFMISEFHVHICFKVEMRESIRFACGI